MIGKKLQVPDYVETATCYRTWELKEGELYPYYKIDEPWNSGKNTAICKAKTKCECAPEKECKCGLYGFHSLELAKDISCGVIGVTEHWGKTEVHEDGLRSQYAQIKALTISKRNFYEKIDHLMFYFLNKHKNNNLLAIRKNITVLSAVSLGAWIALPIFLVIVSILSSILYQQILLPIPDTFGVILFALWSIAIFLTLITNKDARRIMFKTAKRSELQEYCKQNNITYVDSLEELKKYHTFENY